MKMGFVLFDGMTALDFAGFYEAVTWMGILKAKGTWLGNFVRTSPK
ncbi:hypothetical protein [Paenibacillus sp. 1P03SA]